MKSVLKSLFPPIVGILLLSSFSKNSRNLVTLASNEDTVYISKGLDSLDNQLIIKFDLVIENKSKKTIRLHESHLNVGYEGDLGSTDYYLDIRKEESGKLMLCDFIPKHFSKADYPGDMIDLAPGHKKKYHGTTSLYAITKPGTYHIKAIFVNQYKFLGESTVDRVVVIDSVNK